MRDAAAAPATRAANRPHSQAEISRAPTRSRGRSRREPLQATALVHEAYIRLVDVDKVQHWNSRGHFFGAAAEAMRRIMVENARRKRSEKHGGGRARLDLDNIDLAVPLPGDDVEAIDEALEKLERIDARKAAVVKLRYFAGLTVPQAAEALGISASTVDNYWAYARAWPRVEMSAGSKIPDGHKKS